MPDWVEKTQKQKKGIARMAAIIDNCDVQQKNIDSIP